MEARKRLRELVDAKEILVLPGAYDALSARLAEAAGFPCVYMTGYGQSASKLGAPDVGLMTMSEMVERAKDMCAAVSVPVICDGDTGFGNVVNLVRTVREYKLIRAAVMANNLTNVNRRLMWLDEADAEKTLLLVLLGVAKNQKYITQKKLLELQGKLEEIGRIIGGLQKFFINNRK